MNYKKSMRIFWLSLCLLLAAGALIITAAWYRWHRAEIKDSYGSKNDGQAVRMTQRETAADDEEKDAAASFAVHPPVQRENTTADAQTQPVSGTTREYRFELKVKDGYLDVYHFHTDNLFFHTGIPYSETTLKQRQELEAGKYFVNEQELYGYLESCTS